MTVPLTKEQVLEAITGGEGGEGCYGIMSTVARRLGCAWHTAQRAVNRCAETRQAWEDENERALDQTEGAMLEQIKAGDGPMIRFHLATKGKARGYVERHEQEVTGKDGGPLVIQIAERIVDADRDPDGRADNAAA